MCVCIYLSTRAHTAKTKFSFVNSRESRQPTAGIVSVPQNSGWYENQNHAEHRRWGVARAEQWRFPEIIGPGDDDRVLKKKNKKTICVRDRTPPSIRWALDSAQKPWFTVIDEGGEGSTPDARQWRYIRQSHIIERVLSFSP